MMRARYSGEVLSMLLVVAVMCGGASLAGCAPGPPIVANPREPWEEEAIREARRGEEEASSARTTAHRDATEGRDQATSLEVQHGVLVSAVADIIGFPFRAAGWLAHVLL